jgi:uncharacterized membrane protein
MKRKEQMKKHIVYFEVSWNNLFLNKEKGREKEKEESKEKLENEVKGEEIIEKEIESVFVATKNVTIPKNEKDKEEIIEKEIESIFVATKIVTTSTLDARGDPLLHQQAPRVEPLPPP